MSTWFRSKKGIVFTSVMANTIIMSTSLRDNTVMLSSSVSTYTVLVHQNNTEACEPSSRNFLLSIDNYQEMMAEVYRRHEHKMNSSSPPLSSCPRMQMSASRYAKIWCTVGLPTRPLLICLESVCWIRYHWSVKLLS